MKSHILQTLPNCELFRVGSAQKKRNRDEDSRLRSQICQLFYSEFLLSKIKTNISDLLEYFHVMS